MLSAHRDFSIQDFRETFDFIFDDVFFQVRREGRVDADQGIVAEVFDEFLKFLVSYGNIFVVGIVISAEDKI